MQVENKRERRRRAQTWRCSLQGVCEAGRSRGGPRAVSEGTGNTTKTLAKLLPTAHFLPTIQGKKGLLKRQSLRKSPSGRCLTGVLLCHLSKIPAALVWALMWSKSLLEHQLNRGLIYEPCWMKSVLLNLHEARCSHRVSHVSGEAIWAKKVGDEPLMKGLGEVLVLFGEF